MHTETAYEWCTEYIDKADCSHWSYLPQTKSKQGGASIVRVAEILTKYPGVVSQQVVWDYLLDTVSTITLHHLPDMANERDQYNSFIIHYLPRMVSTRVTYFISL